MKHLKRRLLAFILSAMMILTTAMPVLAAEPGVTAPESTEQIQVPTPGQTETNQPAASTENLTKPGATTDANTESTPAPDSGSTPASPNNIEAAPSAPAETPETNAEIGTNTPAGEPGNAVPAADPQKQTATITFKSAGNGYLNGTSSVYPPIVYENVEVGTTVPVPSTNPITAYEFTYWKNSAGQKVELGNTVTVGEADETYTAYFAPGNYTITFRSENEKYGTLTKDGQPVSEIQIQAKGNTTVRFPSGSQKQPAKNCDFDTWKDSTGKEIGYTSTTAKENTTYTAVFKPLNSLQFKYKVYDRATGEALQYENSSGNTVDIGGSFKGFLNAPYEIVSDSLLKKLEGTGYHLESTQYSFLYSDLNTYTLNGEPIELNDIQTDYVKLYATKEVKTSTITFKSHGDGFLNGASNVEPPIVYEDVAVGTEIPVPSTDPIRFHQFDCWKNSAGQPVELGETVTVGENDETYTAYFKDGTFTTTFRVEDPKYGKLLDDSGNLVDEVQITVTGEKRISFPKYQATENCKFSTWKDGSGKPIKYSSFTPDVDETYTISFEPVSRLDLYYKVLDRETGEILQYISSSGKPTDIGGFFFARKDEPYTLGSDTIKERLEGIGYELEEPQYTFLYTDLNTYTLNGTPIEITDITTDYIKLYATKKVNTSTITFKSAGNGFLNGASNINPPIIHENVEVGTTVPVPTTKPSRYYEFAYWKNSAGQKIELGDTVEVGENDETYTAYFALGKYTITFRTENEKYGTLAKKGEPVSEIVIEADGRDTVNFPSGSQKQPAKNCEFDTWKDPEGKPIKYTSITAEEDAVYTAVFKPKSNLEFKYKVLDRETGEILQYESSSGKMIDLGGVFKGLLNQPYEIVYDTLLKRVESIGYQLEESQYTFLYSDLNTYTLNQEAIELNDIKTDYVKLYATKKVNTSTITFKSAGNGFLNGASNINPPIIHENVEVGTTVPVPTTNPITYYEFDCWKNSAGQKVELGETVTVGENDETYTAYFKKAKYTTIFRVEDPRYGKLLDKKNPVDEIQVTVTGGNTVKFPKYKATKNCQFLTWKDETGKPISYLSFKPEKDETYTISFEPVSRLDIRYKVLDRETGEILQYVSSSGKLTDIGGLFYAFLNKEYTLGDERIEKLLADQGYELEKPEYTFLYSDLDTYTLDGEPIELDDISKDYVKLYATKKTVNYTVTTDVDGKTSQIIVSSEEGKLGDKMPKDPVKDGYVFKGWNTKKDGSGEAFTAETAITGDITIYAIFEKKAEITPPTTPDDDNKKPGNTDKDNKKPTKTDKAGTVKTADQNAVASLSVLMSLSLMVILAFAVMTFRKKYKR